MLNKSYKNQTQSRLIFKYIEALVHNFPPFIKFLPFLAFTPMLSAHISFACHHNLNRWQNWQ